MRASAQQDNAKDRSTPASLAAKTAKSAGWVVGWRFATRNLGLISTLVLVRLLSPADFGLVALAMGFIGAIDALSSLGPQEALVREPAPDREMYDTAFTMNWLRGLGTAAIVAGAAWPVADFFSEPRLAPVMLALSVSAFILAFENIGIVDFQRDLAFHKEFQLRVIARIIGVVLTIAFAVLWRNYWAIVIGILSTSLVRMIQSYMMSPYRPHLTLRGWRRIIGFSIWVWAGGLVYMAWDKIDSIVIGRLLGATAVGIFAIGWEIGALPVSELVLPLNRALFSGFSEAHRTGRGAPQAYLRVLAIAMVLTVPAGIGISLVADPLVRLALGTKWLAAIPLVQILALAGAIYAPVYMAEALFKAEGKPHLNFHLWTAALCVKAPLLVGFVSAFGLKGAALAVILATATKQLLYLVTLSRRIGSGIGALLKQTWRCLVATAVMAGALAGLGLGWAPGAAGAVGAAHNLIIAAGAGALLYTAALLGLWLAQGRPEGAERDLLRLLAGLCQTTFLARFARPPVDPA
ncbi:MAG TPA: lipopolysaccharide biosynthesis protein [Stellaceae bacterium]|nr:lipopolysaccharide biosynthesis protein [Stellaceae bacterium]